MNTICMVATSIIVAIITNSCGPVISPFMNPSVNVSQGRLQQPLKISKQETQTVQRIAVPNAGVYAKSDDDKRLYKVQLDILIEELKKSRRFDILSPREFQRKADEMNLLKDIYVMNIEELKEDASRVGQALGCDGVLVLVNQTQRVAMGGAVAQAMFVGTASVPFVTSLDLIDSRSAKSVWYQEYEGKFTAGQLGIKNTPDPELRTMLMPAMQPLATDFLNSFNTQ